VVYNYIRVVKGGEFDGKSSSW